MSANDRISNLVTTQVPFFVRNDHENFVKFLEAYYEYLEQDGKTINRTKILKEQHDVDQAIDMFAEKLYDYYLKLVPTTIKADKNIILKHAKDFYTARGTEKSIAFLLNILLADSNSSFYYPKQDVLKASDGKWFIEKSLKIQDDAVVDLNDDPITNDLVTIRSFAGKKIYGATSNATAIVEGVEIYYENGFLVKELKISNQVRDFISGEQIIANTVSQGITYVLKANIISGIIVSTEILLGGNNYVVGTQVPLESNTGNGGVVVISSVTSGSILSVQVIEGGAGFQKDDLVVFTSDIGTGANANVATVNYDGRYHPNTYNISLDLISLESDTPINNSVYANLNSGLSDPANSWISNSFSYFSYSNTGPASAIFLISTGTGFRRVPVANVAGNTRIKQLGILGKMNIVSRGSGYANGELIEFINGPESYGVGGLANVYSVNATGAIMEVRFVPVAGQITGGTGYDINKLPTASIQTVSGVGGVVEATAILGYGDVLSPATDSIGKILSFRIDSGGAGYSYAPTINLSGYGDGSAQALCDIVTGIYTYPGRYLNDDGHVSGYNFIQDRDYYHNYSYVVKIKESIDKYRKALKDLVHPSGMKLFGEYIYLDDNVLNEIGTSAENVTKQYIYYDAVPYSVNNQIGDLNTFSISMNTSGMSVNDEFRLELYTGRMADANITQNRFYVVDTVVNATSAIVRAPKVYSTPYITAKANIALINYATSLYNLYLSNTGDKLFYARSSTIMTFNMSTPYDIRTMSYFASDDIAEELANKVVTFSSNGNFMYIGGEGNTIYQYALTESWNVSTASVIANTNVKFLSSNGISSLYSAVLSNNGTMLYVGDQNSQVIYQFNLATPWYVNTASYFVRSPNTSLSGIDGMHFNANGKILYTVAASNTRAIRMYDLSEAWNVNTMSLRTQSQNLNILTGNTFLYNPSGLFVKPDGNVFYVSDRTGNYLIAQIPTTVTGNANNIIYETTLTGTANVAKTVI
jgi:hypothetical protein